MPVSLTHTLRVQAISDGKGLAFRLRWDDPTKDDLITSATFADACAVQHALAARESGEKKVIVFNLSGHGVFDLMAYDSYLTGKMDRNA